MFLFGWQAQQRLTAFGVSVANSLVGVSPKPLWSCAPKPSNPRNFF